MLPYRAMRARALEALLVVFLASAITVIMTWPLAWKAGHAGRIDTNDGRFSIWNVAWVARALVEQPSGLYDANIFYPHRNTLAYSEANLVAGAMAAPVWAATRNPYLSHNVVVLLGFVLAQVGTYLLVRRLTGRRGAAAVSAVAFAFCPFVFSHIPHIQLLMTAGLPFSLLALHRFIERRSVGRAVTLGVTLAVTALACGYYGIFAGLIAGAGILFYAVSRGLWREPRYWIGGLGAGLLSIALVTPFFLPYVDLQSGSGFARSLDDARRWSADWASYAASAAWAHRWIHPLIGRWSEVLYPGTIAVVFGLAGLVIGLSSPAPAPGGRGRDDVVFYGGLAGLALWASFGPKAGLYAVLHVTIPLFAWLRAPSRMGLVVTLALCVLAGFAITRLIDRMRRAPWLAAGLVILTMADLAVVPLFMVEARPLPEAYATLARWPYAPVAEFPFFYRRIDFPRHAEYMLPSTFHWRPLINGYSDYIPPDFREMVIPVSSFPNPESFKILQQHRVRYVLFHIDLYARSAWRDVSQRIERYNEYLRPIRTEGSVWLYEIVAWPPQG